MPPMDAPTIIRLIAIPLIAAATGYLTNWVAVRMLFRPRGERRVFGLRVQGLIPRRRSEMARKIGDTIERHLISHEDIRRVLGKPEVDAQIHASIDRRITGVMDEKIASLNPMVAMMVTDGVREKMGKAISEEIVAAIPAVTEELLLKLEENLDFRQLVVEKVEEFDLEVLEGIVLSIAGRELRAIEILGGVLGFAIGLATDVLLVF